MILAAGFGTRLWPLTEGRSKPAIPFLNQPLITYSVEYLASYGINEIIVNLHHQPESIRRVLGDGSRFGVRIRYSYEEQILGTSGAIDRVRDMLGDGDFVVLNGKIVTSINLSEAVRRHREVDALATLVLRPNRAREHFSIVEIDKRGWISRFAGFPDRKPGASPANLSASAPDSSALNGIPLMFTGIQVLSPRIFEYVPRNSFSHSTIHVYPPAIQAGNAVISYIANGDWYEMSTLRRYLEASLVMMRSRGLSLLAGAGSVIERGAVVQDSVLWEDVTVGRDSIIREAVIANGVRIPEGSSIERAVVVGRDQVKDIERGKIIGENLVVDL